MEFSLFLVKDKLALSHLKFMWTLSTFVIAIIPIPTKTKTVSRVRVWLSENNVIT